MFDPVEHNYGPYANSILNYVGTDQPNNLQITQDPKCIASGWTKDTVIEYRFNSHGFRTDEFDLSERIICLGDSRTFGVGLHEWQTWPYFLSQLTGKPVWNLGSGSACLDTAYRILKGYLPQLRTSLVVALMPTIDKFELFTENSRIFVSNPMSSIASDEHKQFADVWFRSAKNNEIAAQKTIEAMSYLCLEKNIKFHWIFQAGGHIEKDDCSRCGSHAGASTQKQVANFIFGKLNA